MVKLTANYLFRKLSNRSRVRPRKKGETDSDYLNRITHLQLQSQFIDKIGRIPRSQSISFVYLQNNLIRTIRNLDNFPRLTHLYLQNNYISKMENLRGLKCLRKLYLGSNEISVVEGLEDLVSLTELHLESQRLPQGETLYFDPRTVCQLGRCLKVLNLSDNNLTSILSLEGLASLEKLSVDGNRICDAEEFAETLRRLPSLVELSSEGNPIASDRRYLDRVVVASRSLKILNGKPVDEGTRLFITNLTNRRESRRNRLEDTSAREAFDSEDGFPDSRGDANPSGDPFRPGKGLSKPFPVSKADRGIRESPSKLSATSLSPVFRNSLRVTRLASHSDFSF